MTPRKTARHQALSRARGRPVRLLAICGFWSLVFALLGAVLPLAPLELAENALQDAVVRHGRKNPTPGDLVFLALDEPSMDLSQLEPEEIEASRALRLMREKFPWSRAVYAEVIEKVLAAGAKAIVLDVNFPNPGEGDDELRGTLAKHAPRVVIASLYEDTNAGGALVRQFRPPAASVMPPDRDADIVGFASFWPEQDKVLRVARYRMSDALLRGGSGAADELQESLAAAALRKTGSPAHVPDFGLIRFCEPGSFTTVPLYWLFVPDLWEANLQNGAVFRDKIVVMGSLAGRFRDFFRTPVGTLPGPEIHLHAIAAAANGAFYTRAGGGVVAATCLLMGLVAWVVNVVLKRPLAALGLMGLILAAGAFAALQFYNHANFLPGLLYPALTLGFSGLTAFGYDFALERRERARVRRSLERYVSRDVVRELLDNESSLLAQLGGTRKDVAVLFSDVRGFTSLAEHADPEALVTQLNEYFGEMVRIVFRHHGTLDKFIGDAVMAVWGTVTTGGAREDCLRAVRTALAMLEAVESMRRRWDGEARANLRIGIGVNFGPAVFGNIGSEEKMEPTVIGDVVNLASRLEGVTKQYRVPLVLSGGVAAHVRDEIPLCLLDIVRVSGRGAPVEVYTVILDADARVAHPAWLAMHEEGWRHYRAARFAEALRCFEANEGTDGDLGSKMRERCRGYAANPPGAGWEPVTVLEGK